MKERDDGHAQYDHRERQAVVKLDEPHPVGVGLTGSSNKGDRGELRCHHRQPDRPPRQRSMCEKISFFSFAVLCHPHAVPNDVREISDNNKPIE